MHTHSSFTLDAVSDLARISDDLSVGSGSEYDAGTMSFRVPEGEFTAATKQRPGFVRRFVRRIGALLLFVLALGIIAAVVLAVLSFQTTKDVPAGRPVKVEIPSGADASAIGKVLADEGIVRNKTVFVAMVRWKGDGSKFHSGTYTLKTGSTYDQVAAKLRKGPPPAPVFDVTLPEGWRISQMAAHVDELNAKATADGGKPLPPYTGKDYLAAVNRLRVPAKYQPPAGTTSMEGFLFPATYELRNADPAPALVQKQLDAFQQKFDSIDMSYAKQHNLTPYEIVIIASLVEREAKTDGDRAKIAAVIYNRLHERMTLGIDATIQYAVSKVDWKNELSKSDLAIDSPYNTRVNAGLPPTPIANPGLKSLEAAAHPANVDYLYYVLKPNGSSHYFTKSYDDFLAHQ